MKADWIEHKCNGCGECCIRNPIMTLVDKEEWRKVLEFIHDNQNGELLVSYFNPDIKGYIKLSVRPTLDDFSFERSDLFWLMNDEVNPCPFVNFDIEKAKYYCTIQDIKPNTCRSWYCEPLKSADSEFNICVLNFGLKMEYPSCKICQKSEFDANNHRKIRNPTPCEMGEGCLHLEKRVRYFLAYAKNNQLTNNSIKFANKLIDILRLQHVKYEKFLIKELEPTHIEYKLNINKYADLITEITSVLKKK